MNYNLMSAPSNSSNPLSVEKTKQLISSKNITLLNISFSTQEELESSTELERLFGYQHSIFELHVLHKNKLYTNLLVGSIDTTYCPTERIKKARNFFSKRENVVSLLEQSLGHFGYLNEISEPAIQKFDPKIGKKILRFYYSKFEDNSATFSEKNISVLQVGQGIVQTEKANNFKFQQLLILDKKNNKQLLIENIVDFKLLRLDSEYRNAVINFLVENMDSLKNSNSFMNYIDSNTKEIVVKNF